MVGVTRCSCMVTMESCFVVQYFQFFVFHTVAENSGEFLVRLSGLFFFQGGGNVTVDEVGCR